MPPGYTTDEEGYFLNAEALSNLAAASKTYRLERDEWEKAYKELNSKAISDQQKLQLQLNELKTDLENERAKWRAEVSRARSPGVGVFLGYGYNGHSFEPSIGVGLVFKVF